ncbi:tripartite tricarboxylate transporter TctB family protein [Anianabacter salinae]|uniref:tripartite tricarboxylate transporter TctB family protein n=1 Tax=Anianabacter salinae TaxID=2851023 RepID=UPI00225DE9D8|nr:tripartite tricarboxylate transporter TctB family protein [Anianabacter salinae]MBV0911778.1 tripartite tricarboxylate transporter TctB family protein [Anianabacter salinae]
MSDDPLQASAARTRGQPLFALVLVAVAAGLAVSFPWQVSHAEGRVLVAQPGFWPGVSVAGMLVFGLLHWRMLPRKRLHRMDGTEARVWAAALEYAAWFLCYVLVVPVIGYLLATVGFLAALTWRLGYRSPGMLAMSVALGIGIVVLFKAGLSVKIPGGMIYEVLPGPLRSFFILNF